ncbi:MAG: MBL fold metallo-hydrolase [bacterium]
MRLTEEVYIVGSGRNGFYISEEYDCHVYLIDCGGTLALVDAGAGRDISQILVNVEAEGFRPEDISRIILTHCHADHSGGCRELRSRLGVSIAASKDEAEFLRDADEIELGLTIARASGVYPPDYRLPPCPVDVELEDGDKIEVGSVELTAIATPGHSRGSICYLMRGKRGRYLFCGDVVFFGGLISLLNCPGSSLEDYRRSMPKLAGLGVDVLLPGHLLFCLRGGQKHIDASVEAFKGLSVPRSAF